MAYSVNKFLLAGCVMSEYIVRGGKPLFGTVRAQGSKNSAVAILMSCVAVKGEVRLRRVPYITDVVDCIGIIRYMGGVVEWLSDGSLLVDCSRVEYREIPCSVTARIRASTYLLGACLNRFGYCGPLSTGGCSLGARPINLHMNALIAIGAAKSADGRVCVPGSLSGEYKFPQKTVGGTVNAVVAAVCGGGDCVFENCATEPHVCDLVRFLCFCGANIEGVGTETLTIRGVERLHGCDFTLLGDMIEAGTYLLAGAVTGGEVTVTDLCANELASFCNVLEEMGLGVSRGELFVRVSGRAVRGTWVKTGAFPLFPTDLHPQTVALMGSCSGEGGLKEEVFGADRFAYLSELKKQGLRYSIAGDTVSVFGGGYHSARVNATDLRGGAANIIAALCAEGESVIGNAELIERGYSDLILKLSSLGAEIRYGDM